MKETHLCHGRHPSAASWRDSTACSDQAQFFEVPLNRFPDPETFRPHGIVIRQLRQRWGSMSPARRLLLNKRLIEAPIDAIDYVITHELCHITEPHHGPAFFDMLDVILPDWKKRKHRLEKAMA
ncbi:MAG: M48 family metallopeptidase [Roseicyclus sp.]|nr:M48 family metallopeptidase [Roseicyclus sp.]